MTHDILQSDLDLARSLANAGRQDEEIIAALAHRGVEAAKASEVVHGLRCGLPVKPEWVVPEVTVNPRPPVPAAHMRRKYHHRRHKPWLSLLGSSLMMFTSVSLLVIRQSAPVQQIGSAREVLPSFSSKERTSRSSQFTSKRELLRQELTLPGQFRLMLRDEAGLLLPCLLLLLLISSIWMGYTLWVWNDDVQKRIHRRMVRWAEFG